MKTRNGLTYAQIVLIAFLAELTLVVLQFVYLKIYANIYPEAESGFTATYIRTRGFYIFQIIGFFLYTFIVYVIVGKISQKIFKKILTLVVVGGILELSFYIFIQTGYEGAFIYSILDKVIAAAFGLILFNYTTRSVKKPDSYF